MKKYADMTRKEFLSKFDNPEYEIYTEEQVKRFSQDVLKSIDPIEKEYGAIDFVSLNRVTVVNDDLSKSILFWRPSQIEWKEEINPDTLIKSKTGYYKDTPENRKKGVVGKPYGDTKAKDLNEGAGNLAKLRAEYTSAVKRGDKAKVAELSKKIADVTNKHTSKDNEKED